MRAAFSGVRVAFSGVRAALQRRCGGMGAAWGRREGGVQ